MHSFSSSAPLFSSSNSISNVFTLSWNKNVHFWTCIYVHFWNSLFSFLVTLKSYGHSEKPLKRKTGCSLVGFTRKSRCQPYTVTSIRRISLLRSVCELLSVSSSFSRCLWRLLSSSLSSWALSLSSEHDSSSFFRRDTWDTHNKALSTYGAIEVVNWKKNPDQRTSGHAYG